MTSRFRISILILAVVALLPFSATHADIRVKNVCPALAGFPEGSGDGPNGTCFTGHNCVVAIRGDWLDLTSEARVTSGPSASISIQTGVGPSRFGSCLPGSNKDREGYVVLDIRNIRGTGTMRVRLPRLGGEDTVSITVKDGTTFVQPRLDGAGNTPYARVGEAKVFELEGGNLDKLSLKRQIGSTTGLSSVSTPSPVNVTGRSSLTPPTVDEFVSRTATKVRVRLTFDRSGDISLEDKLVFDGGEPELNRRFGWPVIHVRSADGQTNPPPGQAPGSPTTRPPSTSQPPEPNLTPQRLFAERPLLRKINTLSALMIPMFYCANVANDEEKDVDVPAFEWGVGNDNRTAITQAFSVQVLGGANNTPLSTQIVQSIPQSDIRTFRNWPGRPTRVRVMKVTAANKEFAAYNNSPGCYIPNALVGTVRLDPKPLIIRADSGRQITERVENDNDLVIP